MNRRKRAKLPEFLLEKRPKVETANRQTYLCMYCQVASTSLLQLSEHIISQRHRDALNHARPDLAPLLPCLQYFLDTYMRDKPLVGLEYIVEERGDVYRYKCLLCELWATRSEMIVHIGCFNHKTNYLALLHPHDFAFLEQFSGKGDLRRVLRLLVGEIHRKHGKNRIQEGTVGPAPLPEAAKQRNRWGGQKVCTVKWSHGPARAAEKKQSMMLQEASQQFKHNNQFYNCLRSLDIQSKEDTALISEVARNCIKEVMRFQSSDPSGSQCTDASILVSEEDDCSDPTEICFSGPQNREASDSAALLKEAQLQILRLERLMNESQRNAALC